MITPSGLGIISTIDLYDSSTVRQEHRLGQVVQTVDGRKFRWTKAGELLVTGDCYQSAVQDAQFEELAVATAAAIGATSLALTNGTTEVTANMFDEGYAMVGEGTGIGQSSQIISHTTAANGAALTVTIADPLKVALTTSTSKVNIIKNPQDNVVKYPVTPTGGVAGVAQFAIPSGEYGWLQTGGPAACLFDASVTAADTMGVAPSTTTAGAVRVSAAGTMHIGNSMQVVQESAKVGPVFLTID